jgi:hypothetical protein
LETHPCGRSKKLLKTWLYLSEPKLRTPFPRSHSQIRGRRKLKIPR